MFTFCCGDFVRYTAGDRPEEAVEAVVVGVVSKPKEGTAQACKWLILVEQVPDAPIFFVSSCSQWRRISADSTSDLDPKHADFTAKRMPGQEVWQLWDKSTKLAHVGNADDAGNQTKRPPPSVVGMRKEK